MWAVGREALRQRARRLAAYVGLDGDGETAFAALAGRLVQSAAGARDPLAAYREAVERLRFAAVFTAHPTFGMSRRLAHALAAQASGEGGGEGISRRR